MRLVLNYKERTIGYIKSLLSFRQSRPFSEVYVFPLDTNVNNSSYLNNEIKPRGDVTYDLWGFPLSVWLSYYTACKESEKFTEKELRILKYLFLSDTDIDVLTLWRLLEVEGVEKDIKTLYVKATGYTGFCSYGIQKYFDKYKEAGGPATKIVKYQEKEYNNLSFFFWDINSYTLSAGSSLQGLFSSVYCPESLKRNIKNEYERRGRLHYLDGRDGILEDSSTHKDIQFFTVLNSFIDSVTDRLTEVLQEGDRQQYLNQLEEFKSTKRVSNLLQYLHENENRNSRRHRYDDDEKSFDFSSFSDVVSSEEETELQANLYAKYKSDLQKNLTKDILDSIEQSTLWQFCKSYDITNNFIVNFEFSSGSDNNSTIEKGHKINLKVENLATSIWLLSQEPFVYFLSLLKSPCFKDIQIRYGLNSDEVIKFFFLLSLCK